MKIKLLENVFDPETRKILYRAGSVIPVRNDQARHLIETGFAEEWQGADTVVFVSPEPAISPEAQITPPEVVVTDKSLFEQPVQPFEVEMPIEPEPPAKPKRKAKK